MSSTPTDEDDSWEALRQHRTPQWFRDAKFGIYTHWGVYSVPAFGPNATWYPYNMYRENTEQYAHHVRTYGDPRNFGYREFIKDLNGTKFDPDEWAEVFRDSGARFAGPVAEHHDGFSMWDTRYSEWNSVRMGPRRNVVAELSRAIRERGMKFMVALHHAENWWFFPHWRSEFDVADPKFRGLYGAPHDLNMDADVALSLGPEQLWSRMEKPSRVFLDLWFGKTREVIDYFSPDMLWFDFGIDLIHEHYRRRMLAYYYSQSRKNGRDVVVAYKWHHLVPGSAVVDLELGRFDELTYHEWMTDTTVDAGSGWGYLRDTRYKSSTSLIHYLVDNVSKNGSLLLNVGPKPSGELPQQAVTVLKEIGDWLRTNGEAIFDTSPWTLWGEGPTKLEKAGPFGEERDPEYTGEDIRFTVRGDNLYATALGIPPRELVITSVPSRFYPDEIVGIELLGSPTRPRWKLEDRGLVVSIPEDFTCRHAMVCKIVRRRPNGIA